jgi:hypothetical protein
VQLIILKADILSYGEVFIYAASAMLIGGLLGLILLRIKTNSNVELTPEQKAEAMAAG